MRVDKRTMNIETTTDEIITRVTEYACSTREVNSSQTDQLSVISSGIQSCALEITEQKNLLLEFQDKLKKYVLLAPLTCT